jgi:hypothetical protein
VIAEAIDTALTLGWALLGWITVLAVFGTICIFTAAATGAWTARLIWRAAGGPAWARGRREARRIARATRPDYQEAA